MNTLSTSQPTERVLEPLANDPMNGLSKGDEQADAPANLALEEAKSIVASLVGEGDTYGISDVQDLIHTLANLDRKTARAWARQLTAHAQFVSSE